MQTTTLRPGLLVSLKTSIRGNVQYRRLDIEPEHDTADGAREAKWETDRRVELPEEHKLAVQARAKVVTLVRGCCSQSSFGLLCPEAEEEKLRGLVAEAQEVVSAFNSAARVTRVEMYLLTGRIAPDDVQAVRAINSDIRDLMAEMQAGIELFDVERIRFAAKKAKSMGQMLEPLVAKRVEEAVVTARVAAKDIRKAAKAGEVAAREIDRIAIERIARQRTAFLDLEDAGEVAAPAQAGRSLDLEPEAQVAAPRRPAEVPDFEMA